MSSLLTNLIKSLHSLRTQQLQRFIIIACGRKSGFHFHHNCGVPDKTFLEISVHEGGKLPNYEKLINCFFGFKTRKSMKITGEKNNQSLPFLNRKAKLISGL